MAKAIVYIDGFNLYYRALQKPEHKWLDVRKLAEALLPDDEIKRINYYTALIKPSKIDPRKHVRQQAYFRALRTLEGVTLHYGNYVANRALMPKWKEWREGKKALVSVAKHQEKVRCQTRSTPRTRCISARVRGGGRADR